MCNNINNENNDINVKINNVCNEILLMWMIILIIIM